MFFPYILEILFPALRSISLVPPSTFTPTTGTLRAPPPAPTLTLTLALSGVACAPPSSPNLEHRHYSRPSWTILIIMSSHVPSLAYPWCAIIASGAPLPTSSPSTFNEPSNLHCAMVFYIIFLVSDMFMFLISFTMRNVFTKVRNV